MVGYLVYGERRKVACALAEWLSWLEHHPEHLNVTGSIPRHGTYLGSVEGGQQPLNLSLSLSQINQHILR